MYNIKTNSSRKESYKYNKPFNNKKRQNGSHYQHNKYNKYKSRHTNSDTFCQNLYEYDSSTFYKKDSKKIKKLKKKDLIEVNEQYKINAEEQEIKENSSSHENSTNDYQTQEKTLEKSDKINTNCSYNNFDEEQDQDLNSSENNTIIFPNRNSLGRTNSQVFSEDKENFDSNIITNSPHISNLNKPKNNNPKENTNSIISSINLTSEDLKEAFYVPKKHNNLYSNSFSNENLGINSYLSNECNKFNEIISQTNSLQKAQKLNMLLNNNNNYLLYSHQNSQNLEQIQPFSAFDSHSSNSFHHKSSFDSFRSSIKSGSIIENEREKENTDILEIHVKISKKEKLVFKIRRYDDMFKTVKIFCEINKLDIKLIRPLIIYIIKALNSIYGIYNLKLKSDEIQFIKDLKNEFGYDEEIKDNYRNNDYDNEDNFDNDGGYFGMNIPKNIYNY